MKQWTQYGKAQVEVNGVEYIADIKGNFVHYKDGEDADGNRGWWVTECDDFDVNVESITPTPPTDEIEVVTDAFYDLDTKNIQWDDEPGEPDEN